ncbi:ABC transporter ATP-binding protein [Jatrophihabitans endophyticus]|uniref:ABC transporter ATP-binding protein n=1 Tax=Jatrophihabitans endophyticus TaxID=1206085 RepID=UPI0019DA2F79|nr:ATP-binding cassette domain-containing protein [Jatrophihabitans endophyticus]MBE7188399.1 ATP-binding cassette domain-containing protein [Jatrophihabitans endophyticus]
MTADDDALAAVRVEGVSKWFGEVTALDDVHLDVPAGQVHGLVGPNGAGKTTLLSILFGMVRHDEGEVRLFGRTRPEAGTSWLDGVGGFVETPRFYPHLSGRQNLISLAALDGGDGRGLVDDVLELVGLDDAAGRKVRGYSLGMRQRLGLAAAALRRPRLLILDEPTNGMDPSGIHHLRAGLSALSGQGVAVLFSSHDIRQVEQLCDAVTVLDRGTVVLSTSVTELYAMAPTARWRVQSDDDAAAAALAGRLGLAFESSESGAHLSTDEAGLRRWTVECGRAGVGLTLIERSESPLEALMLRLVAADPAGAAP